MNHRLCTILFGLAMAMASLGLAGAEPPSRERIIIPVSDRSAEAMAKLLSEQFAEQAVVSTPPAEYGRCLVVSAAPETIQQILGMLEKLDQAREARLKERLLRMEIVEFRGAPPAPKDAGGELDQAPFLKEFQRPYQEVRRDLRSRIDEIIGIRTLELKLRDEQPAIAQVGETVPTVRGASVTAGGRFAPSYVMDSQGLIARATSQFQDDGQVLVTLDVEESRQAPDSEGQALIPNEKASPVIKGKQIFSAKTTVVFAPGETQGLAVWYSPSQTEPMHRVVLATLDPPAPEPRRPPVGRTEPRPPSTPPSGAPAAGRDGFTPSPDTLARMANSLFKRLDTNSDGQVDQSEWDARRKPAQGFTDPLTNLETALTFPVSEANLLKAMKDRPLRPTPSSPPPK
jgi:hypothetical protein